MHTELGRSQVEVQRCTLSWEVGKELGEESWQRAWRRVAVCQPAKPPKCFPAAPMPFASPGIVLLWWFKPAVCQPAKGDDEAPQLVALARQAQQLPEISTLDYP